MDSPEEKTLEQVTARLMSSFDTRRSRRSLLKGATVAGAAGITALGAGAFLLPKGSVAHASPLNGAPEDSVAQILSIAATAEQLAVTFYGQGIKYAHKLNISGVNLSYLQAAIVEEQLHRDFLVAAGGKPLTDKFSFPQGDDTFDDIYKFIKTLDQLETAFEAAYLAAVMEFAQYNQPRLAQIAAQIGIIEGEHRTLGVSIPGTVPVPNNHAYAQVLVDSVTDAAEYLASAGYLSPKHDNSYTYHPVSTYDPYVSYRQP